MNHLERPAGYDIDAWTEKIKKIYVDPPFESALASEGVKMKDNKLKYECPNCHTIYRHRVKDCWCGSKRKVVKVK